jgi:hypothetical protein
MMNPLGSCGGHLPRFVIAAPAHLLWVQIGSILLNLAPPGEDDLPRPDKVIRSVMEFSNQVGPPLNDGLEGEQADHIQLVIEDGCEDLS